MVYQCAASAQRTSSILVDCTPGSLVLRQYNSRHNRQIDKMTFSQLLPQDCFTLLYYLTCAFMHNCQFVCMHTKQSLTVQIAEIAPSGLRVLTELAIGIVVYDLIFWFIHVGMHRSRWLYNGIHKRHHTHVQLGPTSTTAHTLVCPCM